MTDLLFAVGATAVSLTIMFAICLRPMHRARRATRATSAGEELARLRQEVADLRDRAAAR